MCGFLGLFLLLGGHIGVAIRVAKATLTGKYLVPNTGGRVSPKDIIEVVSVSAKHIAHSVASILHGCTTRDEQKLRMRLQNKACSSQDTIVHYLLALPVTRESRMAGILGIGPSLHPTELRGGLIGADTVYQRGKKRLIGLCDTAIVACLLKGDIVPLTQTEGLAKRERLEEEAIAIQDKKKTV